MIMNSILSLAVFISLLLLEITSKSSDCIEFNPITRDGSFRAIYRVYGAKDTSHFESEALIYEQYQHEIGASSIWMQTTLPTRREVDTGNEKGNSERVFLYNTHLAQDIEVEGPEKNRFRPRTLDLFDDGGSLFANPSTKLTDEIHLDTKLVEHAKSIDTILLAPFNSLELHLNDFIDDSYLKQIDSLGLGHIRGLSGLFHLVESKRDGFKPVSTETEKQPEWSTGGRSHVSYDDPSRPMRHFETSALVCRQVAPNSKESVLMIERLEVAYEASDKTDQLETAEKLPNRRILPKSFLMVLPNGHQRLIEVVLFEALDSSNDEHLSTWSACSPSFLLPLASGASDFRVPSDLQPASDSQPHGGKRESQARERVQFSLDAELRISGCSQAFCTDPIGIRVAYDSQWRLLAREITIVDRRSLSTNLFSWRRHKSRLVYDARHATKFHIMRGNLGYVSQMNDEMQQSPSDQEEPENWHGCTGDSLSSHELIQIDEGELYSSVFDTSKALFMGMAMVRGQACNVYERQLDQLPPWMGLNEELYAGSSFPRSEKIYIAIYEAPKLIGRRLPNQQSGSGGKPLRIEVRLVPTMGQRRDTYLNPGLVYRFDLLSFENFLTSDRALELFDISQDCLFVDSEAGYVETNFRLALIDGKKPEKLASFWEDPERRRQLVTDFVTAQFGFGRLSQVDLEVQLIKGVDLIETESEEEESEVSTPKGTNGSKSDIVPTGSEASSQFELDATVRLYELPRPFVRVRLLGDASRHVIETGEAGWPAEGVASFSSDDCLWRAVHSIRARNFLGQPAERLVAFCPMSSTCLLGQSQSVGAVQLEATQLGGVVEFPARENASEKCQLLSVSQEELQPGRPTDESALMGSLAGLVAKRHAPLTDVSAHGANWRLLNWHLSPVVKPESELASRPIPGLGYIGTGSSDDPTLLQVNGVAECSHACLFRPDCASYSVCRRPEGGVARLDCRLSRLNWTHSSSVQKLRSLASRIRLGSGAAETGSGAQAGSFGVIQQDVWLADGRKSTKVELRRSSRCSLHGSHHSDLFELVKVLKRGHARDLSTLIADSIEDCARLCLDRAQLAKLLARMSKIQPTRGDKSFDPASYTCGKFVFGEDSQTCHLYPIRGEEKDWLKVIEEEFEIPETPLEANRTYVPPIVARWLAASRAKDRSNKVPKATSGELIDIYKLSTERLFIAWPANGLEILKKLDELEGKKLANFDKLDVDQCARECIIQPSCRSFNLIYQEEQQEQQTVVKESVKSSENLAKTNDHKRWLRTGELTRGTCTLFTDFINLTGSTESGLQQSLISTSQRGIERGENDADPNLKQTVGWHYEPNELTLYLKGELSSRVSLDDSSENLLLRVQPFSKIQPYSDDPNDFLIDDLYRYQQMDSNANETFGSYPHQPIKWMIVILTLVAIGYGYQRWRRKV